MSMRGIFALLIVGCAVAPNATAQENEEPLPLGKKLIEYGWDVPFPDDVEAHIRDMEKRPFDGLIFKLRGGGKVLTPDPWAPEQFTQDYETVQRIGWDRFTNNFVIMWAASDQDWFNDGHWDAIVNNTQLVARAARLAKCVGVCFDAEPYGTNPWLYAEAAHRDAKTFAEYEAVVRRRGAQFIKAVEQELPNPEILTFFLVTYVRDVCLPMAPAERAQILSGKHYGLLPAFLNGMLDGAAPGTRFIDGNETAYYYTDKSEYLEKYHLIMDSGRYLIDPALWDKYRAQVEVGQALYVDQYFGLRTQRVLGHYLTPPDQRKWFEHNVYWSLYTADKYVWCYSERMDWWKNEGVPEGCEEAIRSARAKLATGAPLGFDMSPIVADAKRREREAVTHKLKDRRLDVPKLAGGVTPPAIDGALDDAAWQAATALEPFESVASIPEGVKAATEVKVTWNSESLFVAFRCAEPAIDTMTVAGERRDDPVFDGDVVEVFITPEQAAPCYHLAVNPRGVFWDGVHPDAETLDTRYDPDWTCAANIQADSWTVEMAIPWKALDIESPGNNTSLRANFCRERNSAQELSAWSPTIRLFLEPEHFGTLVLKE